MLTFVKIGGSLITDKTVEKSYRADAMNRIATQLKRIYATLPEEKLIIGHGSGSFGHYPARRHGTLDGVHTAEDWQGFADVATAAYELNHYVLESLVRHNLPIWRLQPSASTLCRGGKIQSMFLHPLITALENGLIPLVHGDVAIDEQLGGTIISTESIFFHLAQQLSVDKIILLGEVEGVKNTNGDIIPVITTQNFEQISGALGGSRGVDVTGGMYSKVHQMLSLTQQVTGLKVHIIDGRHPNLLFDLVVNGVQTGTSIHA